MPDKRAAFGELLRDKLDKGRLGFLGHGVGGRLALLTAAPMTKNGLRGVLLLDPIDQPGLADPLSTQEALSTLALPDGIPLVLLGEDSNPSCAPLGQDAAALFAAASPPAALFVLRGAGYGDFVDEPERCGPCRFCGRAMTLNGAPRELAQRYTLAYFRYSLLGRQDQKRVLLAEGAAWDEATGALRRATK
jgi:pimeloyl-ACP methyl ester carboxylesterase